ncbi:MAG: hypothetical protein ABSE51_05705 [Terracidiphilus sp.]|jgi:hypothetical protein
MNFKDKFAGESGEKAERDELQALGADEVLNAELNAELEPALDEALRNFRLSVHAWSEAVLSRPQKVLVASPHKRLARLAVGWALGGVLVASGVSAGVWQHHRQEMKIAAMRAAERERPVAQQQKQQARVEDEDLLANVDSDVSREVPAAMEPLAQLTAEDGTK